MRGEQCPRIDLKRIGAIERHIGAGDRRLHPVGRAEQQPAYLFGVTRRLRDQLVVERS